MPKVDQRYIKIKKHIHITICKIDKIFNSCIQPKILKCCRINCLLKSLNNDINKLESYNNEIIQKHLCFPELEDNIINTRKLYYNYMIRLNHCSQGER